MNFGRNEVVRFQYASTSPNGKKAVYTLGTTAVQTHNIFVTDIKMTAVTALTMRLIAGSQTIGKQPLVLKCPANDTANFTFEMPWKVTMVSSTLEPRYLHASCNQTDGTIHVSGYMEKV